ncbi:MAG TPA: homoserine O-acetyltransferase [Thermomicrobiales bacterium]|nr:homoserine O-acetyltransferase [Thermomicrobiales bacterium]
MADRHGPSNPAADDTHQRPRLRVVRPDEGHDADGALQTMRLGAADLELGGRINDVTLAYRTWGTLNAAGDNAVLILHALTGDSLAAGPGGWWEPVIGPARAIDTDRHFVISANVLGGCQGSTGPATINPETGKPWAMTFPLVTIGDIVATQRTLVERLGVTRVIVAGGSIGGFQALEWATRHADLVDASVPIAAGGSLGAQGIALHGEIGRRAIMADPDWRNGEYQEAGVFPSQGLSIARMAAMVTYHSRQSLGDRFGRNAASRPVLYPAFGPTFDVEGYLHYHGDALTRRFDANSYLYLTRAMDLYDVARDGGIEHWLGQIDAPMLLIGISSDWLFPSSEIRVLADHAASLDKDVTFVEIESTNGHDAFLKDWDQLTGILQPFMEGASRTAARSASRVGGCT